MNHELVRLAKTASWDAIEARCGEVYSNGPDMPPLPTRLMSGLAIIKHKFNLSDEELCARWVENPYFQILCGETFFRHDRPFDRSSMTRWRRRMGEGTWRRPDLALYKFVDATPDYRPIDIYNKGDMYRDFTYVDDPVRGIRLLIDAVAERPQDGLVPEGDSFSPIATFRIVNIGISNNLRLLDFVVAIEYCLKKMIRNYMPMQMGDVPATWADATLLQRLTGYSPQTDIRDGIARFVEWFREYYGK